MFILARNIILHEIFYMLVRIGYLHHTKYFPLEDSYWPNMTFMNACFQTCRVSRYLIFSK